MGDLSADRHIDLRETKLPTAASFWLKKKNWIENFNFGGHHHVLFL